MLQPALFLDRDGIINVDHGYVHRAEDFAFVDGIFELCRLFAAAGWRRVVVTNQSGIARGYFDESAYERLTDWMCARFAAAGAALDAVYHCPHHPGVPGPLGVACDCRKPRPGLILRAARDLGLDLAASVLVGDKARDVAAARRAGVGRAWLVSTDAAEIAAAGADAVFPSVAALAAWPALNKAVARPAGGP